MRRAKKRARGGFALISRIRPAMGDLVADRGYRSTLCLLKYGLAGRAIMTTAIASPASNDRTSIVLTHLRVSDLAVDF